MDCKKVILRAADGHALAARHAPCAEPKGAVLICSATGLRQYFYQAFAVWLAGQGYAALTFDYRGIGDSLHNGLRKARFRLQDWGQLDIPAALDWLSATYPGIPLNLIGHSAGGQLVGLAPNHGLISRLVQVSCSTGYIGGIRWPMRWTARYLLSVHIPLTARLLGYVPAKRIGWGEDLPAGVAQQWARWCLSPGYYRNDAGGSIKEHYYDRITAPISSIVASDDPIATPKNVADLLDLFPAATGRCVTLRPSEFGLRKIGHVRMFRPAWKALWPIIAAGLMAKPEAAGDPIKPS